MELVDNKKVRELLKCIEYQESEPLKGVNLIVTKENIETIINDDTNRWIYQSRKDILKFLYFVWLEGIKSAPEEWWCENLLLLKELVIVSTCLESTVNDHTINPIYKTKIMEIPQVLLKLWDYITTQERNGNWKHVLDTCDELCKKHNELRELYFC
jgi:hypothetical protein